eukprot:3526661-Rhodomonas_salina.2
MLGAEAGGVSMCGIGVGVYHYVGCVSMWGVCQCAVPRRGVSRCVGCVPVCGTEVVCTDVWGVYQCVYVSVCGVCVAGGRGQRRGAGGDGDGASGR